MELSATVDCKDVTIAVNVCSEKLVRTKLTCYKGYNKLEQFHVPGTSTYWLL